MKRIFSLLTLATAAAYGFKVSTLKGTYKYAGSAINGKYEPNSEEFNMERRYDNGKFDAFVLEDGKQPFKYQSGKYKLKNDSCFETETFNAQSAVLTGKTLKYSFTFHQDTLILKGILPNGNAAEEHWVRTGK
ncbi:hypothetical protein [Mucilaginibacter ginkgonis]|uniref:Lipocalin-like protein n=1 Tax=Mucilaginibacter ginkgonis TaxID=2682091 RepID=A0A6I4HXM0_9SPHI|nr:hypothetical protein [Mucilaginibacter ginkgonis]QQL51079.1 hypothetical protein GO620_006415 [Mucilaginibacter ginkgonis]